MQALVRFYGTGGMPPKNVQLTQDADIDDIHGVIVRKFEEDVEDGKAAVVHIYVDDHAISFNPQISNNSARS